MRNDSGTRSFTVQGLTLPAGAHAVLGVGADPATNGGQTLDFAYDRAAFTLGNADDEIALDAGGVIVDRVAYDDGASFPDPAGASMSLDPVSLDAISNDDGARWCVAVTPFGAGDLGTPGAANPPCPTGPALPVELLAPGALVITEVLQNALAVSDELGEWFEVHNPGARAIDLLGLAVVDDAGLGFTVDAAFELAPGGFAVFAVSGDPALNGGLLADVVFDRATFVLGNGSDEIVLFAGATEIDRVAYDNGLTSPDPEGASMSLDPGAFDAGANDVGGAWCTGVTPYGAGDLGTPGAPNPPCAP